MGNEAGAGIKQTNICSFFMLVFPLPGKVQIANSTMNAWTETGK